MLFRQLDSFRPEACLDLPLVDVLGQPLEFVRRMPFGQLQRSLLRAQDMFLVLTDSNKPELVPGEPRQVAEPDEAALPRSATDVIDPRALKQGVIHVEERDNRPIVRQGPGFFCVHRRPC